MTRLDPRHEIECVEMVRACLSGKTMLEITGGATKRGIGHRIHAGATLSMRGMTGVVSYNPAEMVMTAKAGTPLAEIEAALADKGQMLAFEPPDYRALLGSTGEPTVGGLFACNLSGPRRFQSGAARDHLLGLRFVNGRGEIVQAGGRVMKNVTGLDLVKLMAGSFGTLGLMTELTFKVLPRPETSATLILSGLDDEAASAAMAKAMALPLEVSGAAYLPESCKSRFLAGGLPEGAALALRLEGLAFSVAERMEKQKAAFAGLCPLADLDREESEALWRAIRDVKPFHADGSKRPVWKVSVAPMAGEKLLSMLRMQTGVDGYYDWQGGLVWLRMEAEPEADLLRAGIRQVGGGHATLIRAEDAERDRIPIFEPQPPALAALTERVRASFDPMGLFNPGRMTGPDASARAA
jgi:glycolate oxidase FAD binding subunit